MMLYNDVIGSSTYPRAKSKQQLSKQADNNDSNDGNGCSSSSDVDIGASSDAKGSFPVDPSQNVQKDIPFVSGNMSVVVL